MEIVIQTYDIWFFLEILKPLQEKHQQKVTPNCAPLYLYCSFNLIESTVKLR